MDVDVDVDGNENENVGFYLPIALSTTILLRLSGVGVSMASLSKEAWQLLGLVGSDVVAATAMDALVVLVGASHYAGLRWIG